VCVCVCVWDTINGATVYIALDYTCKYSFRFLIPSICLISSLLKSFFVTGYRYSSTQNYLFSLPSDIIVELLNRIGYPFPKAALWVLSFVSKCVRSEFIKL